MRRDDFTAGVRFGSVCSGIEAASVAFGPLGWRAAWFAEIEPFPCAVLAHHYPDVANLGDMTTIARRVLAGEVEAPDALCGGTPCQAFSVAGLRESLADERGNLTLKFVELADAIDFVRGRRGDQPAIVFWENVPGVLSTKDNAFGCFLAGLAGEDEPLQPPWEKWGNAGAVYGPARAIAWRTLDAQYFGLAQRRRRVFVVASAREGFDPATVLFEWEGLRRDTAPRREAGEGSAGGFGRSVALRGREGGGTAELGDDVQSCLRASTGGGDKPHVLAFGGNNTAGPIDVATARNACASASASGRMDSESETFIAFHGSQDPDVSGDITHPVGRNQGQETCVAVQASQSGVRLNETVGTLDANYGSRRHNGVMHQMQVRRLTPRECERLQGFPDDYTLIPWRGHLASECPDGPRYKAIGNSWAINVVRWIGRRIDSAIKASHENQEAA